MPAIKKNPRLHTSLAKTMPTKSSQQSITNKSSLSQSLPSLRPISSANKPAPPNVPNRTQQDQQAHNTAKSERLRRWKFEEFAEQG